jgi:hypothetical protein
MARKIAPMKLECEVAFVPAVHDDRGGTVIFKGEQIKRQIESIGYNLNLEFPDASLPIGIRWRISPDLGLPITPFSIFRKGKKSTLPMKRISIDIANADKGKTVKFKNGPFYRAIVNIKNTQSSTANYAIAPLDAEFQDSRGRKQFFNAVAPGSSFSFLMDQPYLGGLHITGSSFEVVSATGITMQNYVNDPDWKLIQIVGLPFHKDSIDRDLYDTGKQGFVNTLLPPEEACRQRIDIYKLFYKNSPAAAPGGTPIPEWKVPDGAKLEKSYQQTAPILNGVTGTLNDIKEMLTKVYQTAPELYSGLQKNYLKEIKTLGIVDPANPNPSEDGTFQHPVCAATILSASTDNWHALGLGFGTLDFLPLGSNLPNNVLAAVALPGNIHAFDYMISASFRIPKIILVPQQDGFSIRYKQKLVGFEEGEYATLSHFDIQKPLPPLSLLAETIRQNRPLTRDDHYYEHVRLSWERTLQQEESPMCYSIAFKDNLLSGGAVRFLNETRPFIEGTNQPYVPAVRADENAEALPGREGNDFDRFHHDRSSVPFAGSITQHYYVATQNVFGLWSRWSVTTHTLVARTPQVPQVISANLSTNHEGITTHNYPGSKLEITVAWDWEDRTPFEIQLAGYFISPPVEDPPTNIPGIINGNNGGTIVRYRIRFNGFAPQLMKPDLSNNLIPVAVTEGSVEEDESGSAGSSDGQPSLSNPDMRTYRVSIKNIALDFTSETKLYFTAYARASEMRNPALLSGFSKPVVVQTADPVPRNPPVFVPDIRFATLPDVNNISRYQLQFPPVPGAISYAVYLATEMILLDRLTSITNYPKEKSIFQRRDALNTASINPVDRKRAIDAFTRVNKNPLTLLPGKSLVEIELELNGDTQGLFIYAVSSFTEQGAESPLSDWIYVVVPEKITPGPPVLNGVVNKKLPQPKASIKLNVGDGRNTESIELYRTNKAYLGSDIDMMGLPVSIGPTTGWTKFRITGGSNDEAVNDPLLPFDYYKIEEEIPTGWAPFYYRAVSLGTNQPTNGKLPGRSPASNLLELLPPAPSEAPTLTNVSLSSVGVDILRLSFQTNAYVGKSPFGNHTIKVYKQNEGTLLFDPLTGGDIPDLRKLTAGESEPLKQLVRLPGIDSTGTSAYALNLGLPEKIVLKIEVFDPLGRKSEQVISFSRPPEGVIISDIKVRSRLVETAISFKTNVSKVKPRRGQNTLTILLKSRSNVIRTLLNVGMHTIPDRLPPFPVGRGGVFGGTQQGDLFVYGVRFRNISGNNPFNRTMSLIIQLTDFKGNRAEEEIILNER